MPFARNAVVIGGAVAVTVWLIAAAQSPAPTVVARRVGPSPRAVHVPSHAERLHDCLAHMPDAAPGARDPFRFSSASPGPRVAPPTSSADIQAAPAPARLATPDLRLLGVAEDGAGDQVRRTAIISGMNQLFLVKEGEQLALRYQVTKVSAEAVEIADLASGTSLRLALR